MSKEKCKHELVGLSNPSVSTSTSLLQSLHGYIPPYFQCKKCLKVFTVDKKWETLLIEVTICENK